MAISRRIRYDIVCLPDKEGDFAINNFSRATKEGTNLTCGLSLRVCVYRELGMVIEPRAREKSTCGPNVRDFCGLCRAVSGLRRGNWRTHRALVCRTTYEGAPVQVSHGMSTCNVNRSDVDRMSSGDVLYVMPASRAAERNPSKPHALAVKDKDIANQGSIYIRHKPSNYSITIIHARIE